MDAPVIPVPVSLASVYKADGPFGSSDDGYPSCVGYCPKNIANQLDAPVVPVPIVPVSLVSREKNDGPYHSSDDGFPSCVGYCPKTMAAREKASGHVVEYKTDDKLDSDIITTQGNIKREESRLGYDLSKGFGEKSQQ
jgi:hypothetical protein